jgi:methyl-accepting chemotaxis protein
MTVLAEALNARDYAMIVLSGAFALTGLALALVILKLYTVVGSLKETVDGITKETVPLIHDVDLTVKGVNQEIERVDTIMSSAQTVAKNVETISHTIQAAVTNPLVKALAFFAGARRASKKFREDK